MGRICTTRVKPPLNELTEPAAIAFSGGGDSTALLYACRNHPHITHAFVIDHGLRETSADEVKRSAELARSLGYDVRTQRWAHEGVATGIQVKARQYRYAAMGQMCRAAGLKHLITAHTADDQAETLLMRLDRRTGWRGLAGMRKAAFAPLWPALMGITLHRPWLHLSRLELRDFNASAGLEFVDDPSNENLDFTRVRARQALLADPDLRQDLLSQQTIALARLIKERRKAADWLSRFANISPHGFVETSSVPSAELCLHLLNAAAGRGGPIDAAKRERLSKSMSDSGFSQATLAGAWVKKTSDGFLFTRDLVAVKGRSETIGTAVEGAIQVNAGDELLWDGRFLVRAKGQNVLIEPAYGQLNELRYIAETKCIFKLNPEVRPCLPVYKDTLHPLGFGGLENDLIKAEAVSAQRLHHLE